MTKRKQQPANAATIGLRIREAREAAGMTQGALGDALGVTYQMVWKYENGKGRLSAEQIAQIADTLRRPVESFYS